MKFASSSRLGPAWVAALAVFVLNGCAQDTLADPSNREPDFAAGDFTGKELQLTSGTVCGASSPKKQLDQSLDEDINAFYNDILVRTAQYEVLSGHAVQADLGNDEFICGGGPPPHSRC